MIRPRPEPEVVNAEVRALLHELYQRLIHLGLTGEEATAIAEVAKRDASVLLSIRWADCGISRAYPP
jgi:hypothetical protein